MDDLIAQEEDGSQLVFSKEDAVEAATTQLREMLNARIPDGSVCRVYFGAEAQQSRSDIDDIMGGGGDDGQEF
jgi:hypothetical protein